MGVIKTCSEYLEESVWGGILDKGAGESIKKEDEYNPEYIDFHSMGSYLLMLNFVLLNCRLSTQRMSIG